MLTLKNKSENLKILKQILKKSYILPQYSFTVGEYRNDESVKAGIRQFCSDDKTYIIRSSSVREDTYESSAAGKYLSILNVNQYKNILISIEKVMDSFDADGIEDNLIFIQPMLEDICISGVAFSLDPNNSGYYYVINYDKSGSTNSVTSGQNGSLETYYLYKDKEPAQENMRAIIESVKEIEELYEELPLDIEFAYTNSDIVYIFQVRPLCVKNEVQNRAIQSELLKDAYDFVNSGIQKKPFLYGDRTIYGIMPDWNPAEIIGTKPRPLAISAYRYLVTDGVWAYQRDNYGYKNLRSNPLMVDIAGVPYIDSRISFNSFIPKEINDELATKLTNYYIESLYQNPNKHDKIEFGIVYSSNSFDLDIRLRELLKHGFTESEIHILERELINLTNRIIGNKDGLWLKDIKKINILQKRRKVIINSKLDKISKIYWLLEDCCRYGTLPFAGLARAGFIAIQLLKSLVSIGILTADEYDCYMGNLNTISKQLCKDRSSLPQEKFMEKYGHLRPGTYDITIQRYDHNPELYYECTEEKAQGDSAKKKEEFTLSLGQYKEIEEKMKERGFNCSLLELFDFIRQAIEWREYSKFIFSENLSDVYELFSQLGEEYGFTRDDMSYMDIRIISDLYSSSWNHKNLICESIKKGKRNYPVSLGINLPPLIMKSDDVYEFIITEDVPNYITLKCVEGMITECTSSMMQGKILIIESADPGYDWVFTHNISGLITKYGGVNSHMAIRAGELGLPAAIGVGERKYDVIKRSQSIRLDCANKKLEILY